MGKLKRKKPAIKMKKKPENFSIENMQGKFLHRFQIDNDFPTLHILYPFLHDYIDFKDECITKYNKLVRRESNIEHYYLDPTMGISVNIDTHNKSYQLLIGTKKVVDQPLLYDEGSMEELIEIIKNVQGIHIHSTCISENSLENEEFVVSIFNVSIDNLKIRTEILDGKNSFLKLPSTTWYEDGVITPGGVSIGTSLDENMQPIDSIISLRSYTDQGYESHKEIFWGNLKFEEGLVKNLSVIIDETNKDNILIKLEIFNLENPTTLFNTTIPIKTSENYLNFKSCFDKNGFCYFSLIKITRSEEVEETFNDAKLNNIIIIDANRREEFIRWIDPVRLDLGGLDGSKKILINEKSLEVGIYKHTNLQNLTDTYVRKIFNELVANKIGLALDLPLVNTSFHMDHATVGVITKLVPPPVFKLSEIKLELVQNFESLIDMVAFDIFICNSDRHIDNICFSKQQNLYYPMLIDHTRCLGGCKTNDLQKLNDDRFPYYLNLTGLEFINERISGVEVFDAIITRIKQINLDEIFSFSLDNELCKFIDSCSAYDEHIFEFLLKAFKKRQMHIESILKESLGL
ncbi:hypothetical protein [Paenibacillus xylanexedens]|uniref:PI3K/PI4K catalytic domain-containing protein n=2 Tax=Paenibacillus xylanexedens TaxID=528191 RepID=A0ABS4RT49_PAEXY|nr:hypothetical protein [Paenibacillus xylanexedens]MBP2246068.1 hypothetical protein [Paenibacillus xylanexedens]